MGKPRTYCNIMSIDNILACFDLEKNIQSIFIRNDNSIKPLDGLRAIAILYVMLFHSFLVIALILPEQQFVSYLANFPKWLSFIWQGGLGVDIFFVLSGYLIGTILIREYAEDGRINVGRFFLRRIFRLMPIYILAIIICANFDWQAQFINTAWANFLYLNNFLSFDETFMNWTWSLAVEAQFYIIFPFFLTAIFFKTKHKIKLLLILLIAGIAVRGGLLIADGELFAKHPALHIFPSLTGFDINYINKVYVNLYTRFTPLVIGVLLATVNSSNPGINFREKLHDFFHKYKITNALLLVLSILGAVAIIMIPLHDQMIEFSPIFKIGHILFARLLFSFFIGYILIVSLATINKTSRSLTYLLSLPIWFPIAQLSYAIYLLHLLVIPQAFGIIELGVYPNTPEIGVIQLFLTFLVTVLISSFIAFISFVLVEKPFMNMRQLLEFGKTNMEINIS